MCGIAGFIKREGTPEQALLQVMAGRLAHRGPDDAGVHIQDNIGLAHTRLSIIDLGGGHQPLLDADRRLALVANGEIYNYIELREELIARGCSFLTGSDSETILQAYAAYGESFIDKLNGMFAFALYDSERQRLILARDRLGIKPLFYVELPDRIAFASEIKALLPVLPQRPEVNPAALSEFLELRYNTGVRTIIEGIRRLPPGELLVVDRDLRMRRHQYWGLRNVQERRVGFAQARGEFDELIDRVMREHVRSDVPYALFLSGGVDSAVLLNLLTRYQDRPLRTFSVGFSTKIEREELPHAERIARIFNTEHTSFMLDQDILFKRIPHTVWCADDLVRDYAMLPTSILAQGAAEEVKVVFTGEGGDEVFAGYRRYWRRMKVKDRLRGLLSSGLPGYYRKGHWRPTLARSVFGPELRSAHRQFREQFNAIWRSMPKSWRPLRRRQYQEIRTSLPDQLLVKADRILMGHGVEGRVPFLDHRIVEFGFALPDDLKIGGGEGKLFLKRWAEQHLPRDHLRLPKQGFTVPIKYWLQGDFLDTLSRKLPNHPAILRWFRPDGVRRLFDLQRSRGTFSREIWALMHFAIWHELFIQGDGRAPPLDSDPLEWLS